MSDPSEPRRRTTAFPVRMKRVRDRILALPAVAQSIRTVLVVATGLRDEPITLRAAQLTYLTVLSLVPLLAVVFSVFQAVVGTHELQSKLQDFILANLAVGARENIQKYITQYIQRANATAIGGVGFAFLVVSAVSLLASVEEAFNHTFRAPRQRPLALRFGIYWSLLTLGPILLSLSIAATALLQSSRVFHALGPAKNVWLVLAPFLVTVGAFALMYLIVPAVPVRPKPAIVGALIAGFVWELAKFVYAAVSAASVRNNAIYGSLSAIPIFMLWVYVSWILVLFGARVTYAAQERHAEISAEAAKRPLGRELLVARSMLAVARAFAKGRPPATSRQVAMELKCAEAEARAQLQDLSEAGLVRHVEPQGWVPSRPLETISLREVRAAARGRLDAAELFEPALAALTRRWQKADGAAGEVLDVSLAAVVESDTSGLATDPLGHAPVSPAPPIEEPSGRT